MMPSMTELRRSNDDCWGDAPDHERGELSVQLRQVRRPSRVPTTAAPRDEDQLPIAVSLGVVFPFGEELRVERMHERE